MWYWPAPPPGPGHVPLCKAGFYCRTVRGGRLYHKPKNEITGQVDYGSFDSYWQMMMEVGAPYSSCYGPSP